MLIDEELQAALEMMREAGIPPRLIQRYRTLIQETSAAYAAVQRAKALGDVPSVCATIAEVERLQSECIALWAEITARQNKDDALMASTSSAATIH